MMETERFAFPPGWIEQMRPLLGGALPDFLHSYKESPFRGLRVRPGLTPPPDIGDGIPWEENGYYLPLESQAGSDPLHEAGAYYLQEPSAMIPAALLRPAPGERVLDLCAAPGGKSTQLVAYMQNRGVLVCNEPVLSRAQVLSRNLERMGVQNSVAVSAMPEELCRRWPEFFDKILVDAPCSGEGMFRRHPETRLEWNAASPAGCAQRQSRILNCAALMLRPGGLLAYSTCTFNAVENDGVVEGFLKEHPDFSLVPFSLPGLPPSDGMLHIWPHQVKGEGHFAALLKKEGTLPSRNASAGAGLPRPGKNDAALAEGFMREHIAACPPPNALFGGRIVSAPEDAPPLSGVKVLRAGLTLGEIKGRVFVPDHALALACAPLRQIPATKEQARLYQAGQTLPAEESLRGFYALTLNGVSLGWVKASCGQMKNHYPKGLRRFESSSL